METDATGKAEKMSDKEEEVFLLPGLLRVYIPSGNLENLSNFLLRPCVGYTHSPVETVETVEVSAVGAAERDTPPR